jgi:hypothetical protein
MIGYAPFLGQIPIASRYGMGQGSTYASPPGEVYACPEPGGLYTTIQPKDGMVIRGQRPGPGVIPLPASDALCVQYAQASIPCWAWAVGGLAAAGLVGWLMSRK